MTREKGERKVWGCRKSGQSKVKDGEDNKKGGMVQGSSESQLVEKQLYGGTEGWMVRR